MVVDELPVNPPTKLSEGLVCLGFSFHGFHFSFYVLVCLVCIGCS